MTAMPMGWHAKPGHADFEQLAQATFEQLVSRVSAPPAASLIPIEGPAPQSDIMQYEPAPATVKSMATVPGETPPPVPPLLVLPP